MTKKQEAVIVECCEDRNEHSYRDNCYNCAPFWFHIPTCPTHGRKLKMSGYCKDCKKYYQTNVGGRKKVI